MVSVSESIHIDAPVAVVFDFLDDPQNHAEVTPSLAEVRDMEPLDNGGKRVEHTYTMAGVSLDGRLVEEIHENGERMVFGMSGGISGQITIETVEADRGTELIYSATYELPGRVLSSVAEPFVRWYNERQLRRTIRNVKKRLETDEKRRNATSTEVS
jgi:carbon monoxide dehydrogenase subunit G